MGYLVPDIETATVEFVERFGYHIESDTIEDPIQTAYVRFLRLPGAQQWLELISPNSPESKLSNALRKKTLWHHTCYEVNDIIAACSSLSAKGMLVVGNPVPAVAFPDRSIAWLMDRQGMLVELLEANSGILSLASLTAQTE
jgi:methylmalonyl-CoA/ethylmalonyl-CoA epimerase